MTDHDAQPLVTVVIVTWNTAEKTLACVRSVLQHDYDRRLQIVVVDNASSDHTVASLALLDDRIRLLSNTDNEGFARACNQGMAAASTPFLVLLNSDCLVQDAVILRCVKWLQGHQDFGMVGCELRDENGRRIYTAMPRLSVRQSLFENLWLYRLVPQERRPRMLLGGYWDDDDQVEPDWLVGAYICLRREVFEISGGFDPRFFMYGEDSEWGMRLKRLGIRIAYVPRLGSIIHEGAASSHDAWTERERLRRGHEGGLRAYEMLHGATRAQLYRLAQLFGYGARWMVYATLTAIRPSDYYRSQRRMYGWLKAFYVPCPRRR